MTSNELNCDLWNFLNSVSQQLGSLLELEPAHRDQQTRTQQQRTQPVVHQKYLKNAPNSQPMAGPRNASHLTGDMDSQQANSSGGVLRNKTRLSRSKLIDVHNVNTKLRDRSNHLGVQSLEPMIYVDSNWIPTGPTMDQRRVGDTTRLGQVDNNYPLSWTSLWNTGTFYGSGNNIYSTYYYPQVATITPQGAPPIESNGNLQTDVSNRYYSAVVQEGATTESYLCNSTRYHESSW